MVHVCYAIYDKTGSFSRIAAASLQSLYDNTEAWVTVHILHDNTLSEENKEKYIYQARMQGQNIAFYNMDELLPKEIGKIKEGNQGRFSPATMYRLLLMHVLDKNIKKVIYLDSDIIVNMDIAEMFNIDIGNVAVAAVPEIFATYNHMVEKDIINDGTVKKENYFCAGVLMFNMEEYTKYPNLCLDGLEFLNKNPQYDCNDQDILNYNFSNNYYHLPVKYDTFVDALRLPDSKQDELQECIYHYAGNAMELTKAEDIYNQLFFDYYVKTPWFDGSVFLKAVSVAMKARQDTDKAYFNIMKDRNIAICGNKEKDIARLQKIKFNFNGAIFINIYSDPNTIVIEKCIEFLEQNKKEKPLLLIMNAYPLLNQVLAKKGYKEGTDYLDINTLLIHDGISGRDLLKMVTL